MPTCTCLQGHCICSVRPIGSATRSGIFLRAKKALHTLPLEYLEAVVARLDQEVAHARDLATAARALAVQSRQHAARLSQDLYGLQEKRDRWVSALRTRQDQ